MRMLYCHNLFLATEKLCLLTFCYGYLAKCFAVKVVNPIGSPPLKAQLSLLKVLERKINLQNPIYFSACLKKVCKYNWFIFPIDVSNFLHFIPKNLCQGRIQDLIRGAPDRGRPKLTTVHSSIMRAKGALFSMGSWVFHY